MTYASDLFSWYAGSVDADVYFCPERHGTYYGGFYIKDAPAVGHEGYSISEQLTATAGAALCDSSKGYVTQSQAAVMSSLVDTQRNNLYAGATNIVQTRTQIATLLRSLLTSTASSDAVKAQVLALSGTYGDLDGENNYNYATVFAQVYKTLTTDQKTKLTALRKSIMSGTYADGTPFDYSVCTTPFLYSDAITDTSVLAPYITNTDSCSSRLPPRPPRSRCSPVRRSLPTAPGAWLSAALLSARRSARPSRSRTWGRATLTLTTPITVPTGFTLTSSFGSTTLAPGASTTFVVKLNATAAGTYSGKLSFRDNDSTASTFSFTLSGTVPPTGSRRSKCSVGTTIVANGDRKRCLWHHPVGTPRHQDLHGQERGNGQSHLDSAITGAGRFCRHVGFGSTSLAPGASTTPVVRLDATAITHVQEVDCLSVATTRPHAFLTSRYLVHVVAKLTQGSLDRYQLLRESRDRSHFVLR